MKRKPKIWIRDPLGKKRGRIGDKVFRWMYGVQYEGNLPNDYRSSMLREHLEKLERFGAAGITAIQINNNEILKSVWRNEFDRKVKNRGKSVFNLVTKEVYQKLKVNRRLGWTDGRGIQIVPEGVVLDEAEVEYFNGEMRVKPECGDWDGLTGILLLYDGKEAEGKLKIEGSKCRERNNELRRIAQLRRDLKEIKMMLKIIGVYRKVIAEFVRRRAEMLPNAKGVNVTGADPELRMLYEEELRQPALDKTEVRQLDRVFTDIKEISGLEYLPNEEETDEAEQMVMMTKAAILEEHWEKKAEYAGREVKKYMHSRYMAINLNFKAHEDGSYTLRNAKKIKELTEGFNRYYFYLAFYKEDERGQVIYWSDTIFRQGHTLLKDEIVRIYFLVYILLRYLEIIIKIGVVQRE